MMSTYGGFVDVTAGHVGDRMFSITSRLPPSTQLTAPHMHLVPEFGGLQHLRRVVRFVYAI
jgi:hypothetical protein